MIVMLMVNVFGECKYIFHEIWREMIFWRFLPINIVQKIAIKRAMDKMKTEVEGK